jgi:acetolactate synthase-1/2/3 large subunit
VAWDGNCFVVVSTFTNEIHWVARSGETVRVERMASEPDAWHVNSVVSAGGRLFFSVFGRYSRYREWKGEHCIGAGSIVDLATGRDAVSGLSAPHHPRPLDGEWLVCNSFLRELVAVDRKGEIARRLPLGGWTRGLAVTDGAILVGESAQRERDPPGATAAVTIVDRTSWEVRERVPLPCREAYDVVVAPSALAEGVRAAASGARARPRGRDRAR